MHYLKFKFELGRNFPRLKISQVCFSREWMESILICKNRPRVTSEIPVPLGLKAWTCAWPVSASRYGWLKWRRCLNNFNAHNWSTKKNSVVSFPLPNLLNRKYYIETHSILEDQHQQCLSQSPEISSSFAISPSNGLWRKRPCSSAEAGKLLRYLYLKV